MYCPFVCGVVFVDLGHLYKNRQNPLSLFILFCWIFQPYHPAPIIKIPLIIGNLRVRVLERRSRALIALTVHREDGH